MVLIKDMLLRAKYSYRGLIPSKSDQDIKAHFCYHLYGGSGIISVNEVLQSSDQNNLYGNY